jgi:AraC-like DNA-binding protein
MKYREIMPAADLRSHVECVWNIHAREDIAAYAVRPDGCCDLVWSPGHGVIAAGAMPVERRFSLPAGSVLWGIRFHPGCASAYFGAPASELTGALPEFAAVSSSRARRLESALQQASSPEAALFAFAREFQTPLSPVQQAIQAIRCAGRMPNVEWAAAHAGLSPRHFRRLCLEASGLAPRHLCRVLRFRRACEMAALEARPNWAVIAATVGYFDQAHLIRDFREFTASTPVAVFSNPSPIERRYHRGDEDHSVTDG